MRDASSGSIRLVRGRRHAESLACRDPHIRCMRFARHDAVCPFSRCAAPNALGGGAPIHSARHRCRRADARTGDRRYRLHYPTGPGVYGNVTESFSRLYLAGGVTSMRTAGSMNGIGEFSLKKSIDDGERAGPWIDVTAP
jgi:hypothetical protein